MNDPMDDKRIEDYLRGFRPLPAAPLPKRRKPWRLIALAVAAALVLGVLLSQLRQLPPMTEPPPVITIGSASRMLANSSSWNAVIGDAGFAFRSNQAHAAPLGRTALQFLSQEDLSK